jgi:hypothetical protein
MVTILGGQELSPWPGHAPHEGGHCLLTCPPLILVIALSWSYRWIILKCQLHHTNYPLLFPSPQKTSQYVFTATRIYPELHAVLQDPARTSPPSLLTPPHGFLHSSPSLLTAPNHTGSYHRAFAPAVPLAWSGLWIHHDLFPVYSGMCSHVTVQESLWMPCHTSCSPLSLLLFAWK